MSILELRNVTKLYDTQKALDNVTITLEKGKVYGLLGRNGAGKTTLLKAISSMIRINEGTIALNANEILAQSDIAFGRDFNAYYNGYKIRDILLIASQIFPRYNKELEKKLVENFELDTKKNYIKASKGMQTMTSLIYCLCSDAKVLLLDEPYGGLDPINREYFYKILREYYFNENKTVVISSHMITEIEGYFENAVIINKGKIIVNDELENIYKMSFVLEGNNELYMWAISNLYVVGHEKMAGLNKIYIYQQLSKKQEEEILALNGKMTTMDLQKLMVQLVTKKEA